MENSRDKQIEEMASIIHSKVNGANFDDVSDAVVALYNAGYRKASEVAREVIEEAIELARHSADEVKVRADKEANVLLRAELRGQQIGANLMLYALAKLKKKYIGEDINVPTNTEEGNNNGN